MREYTSCRHRSHPPCRLIVCSWTPMSATARTVAPDRGSPAVTPVATHPVSWTLTAMSADLDPEPRATSPD